jgi:hypothetical protein
LFYLFNRITLYSPTFRIICAGPGAIGRHGAWTLWSAAMDAEHSVQVKRHKCRCFGPRSADRSSLGSVPISEVRSLPRLKTASQSLRRQRARPARGSSSLLLVTLKMSQGYDLSGENRHLRPPLQILHPPHRLSTASLRAGRNRSHTSQQEIAIVAPSAATSASSPALLFAPLQELAEQGFAIGLA